MRTILFGLACLIQKLLGAMSFDPRPNAERTESRCQTSLARRYNPSHALASILLAHNMSPRHSGMLQVSQKRSSHRSPFTYPMEKDDRSSRRIIMGPLAPAEESPRWKIETVEYNKGAKRKSERYTVKIRPASNLPGAESCPPLLCIPPVGVGISQDFFQPLLREWDALGAPCEMHAPDLLGCGSATPKPRRFYTPELWADQLLDYIKFRVKRPVVLVVQGGLLPVALEMWRKSGKSAIVGVSFISAPPLRFFVPSAAPEVGVRSRFQNKPAGRGRPRLLWFISQTSLGGFFFRYLRDGEGQPRIKSFSERNLFAKSENVDSEWMRMCYEGSRDTRSRFATFAYLCGTVPGGSWRDDRSELLKSLNVPTQVLRGDSVEEAKQRLETFLASVPQPSCCGLIAGGRSVIPYENAKETAKMLALFVAKEFNATFEQLPISGS